MAKYTVHYSVSDPTGSRAGIKSFKTVEASSPEQAKQVFKEKHSQVLRDRVANNVSSTQLGNQNPRVTVRNIVKAGSSGSGVKSIQDKMLLKPNLKRPGGK